MFNNGTKQAEQLVNYFQDFDLTDLLGFGQILGIEEDDDFAEFCTNIIVAFCQENRLKRKQLLKLAKDIAVANSCMVPADHTPGDIQGE